MGIIEFLQNPTTFTFRTWEGITYNTRVPHLSVFYPNMRTIMNSTGDLSHHTSKAVIKSEFWITDKLGFRNNEFNDEIDVLIIGDSFIAGSSLSQDETITNKLKSKFNGSKKIYNMSPSSFSQFDYYLRTGVIKKPKIMIFSIVERFVPDTINRINENSIKSLTKKMFEISNLNVYLDRILRLSSIRWLKARINNNKGVGLQSEIDTNMFFLIGKSQKHLESDLRTSIINIKSYKRYCDSLNIKFVFMPMVDKETVYYELVPFNQQPNYLLQMDSLLNIEGITTVNTLKIYNDYRKSNNALLYHLDDTHWNSNATELISNAIYKIIK